MQLAEQIESNELLIKATDEQYGAGIALYIAEAIKECCGQAFLATSVTKMLDHNILY